MFFCFLIIIFITLSVYFTRASGRLVNFPAALLIPLAISLSLAFSLDLLSSQLVKNSCYLEHKYCSYFIGDTTRLVIFYFFAILGFCIPCVFVSRIGSTKKTEEGCLYKESLQSFLGTLFLVYLVLIATIYLLGYFPLYEMYKGNIDINEHIRNLSSLPYGLMALNLALAIVMILKYLMIDKSEAPKSLRFFFYITLLLVAFWQGNRQIMAFYLISLFFINLSKIEKKQDHKKKNADTVKFLGLTLLIALAFWLVFILVNYIRLPLNHASPINELIMYVSWPQFNLVSLLNNLPFWPAGGHFHYLYSQLIPARLGGKDLWQELHSLLFEPTAPIGYFAYWFLDFGYIGVFWGGLFLGLFSSFFDSKRYTSLFFNEAYLLCLYCISTSFLYSHLITLTYFWGPLIILYLINNLSKKLSKFLYSKS